MKAINLAIACALLLAATAVNARQEKVLICHVGNEASPSGETYLDDPYCVPSDLNDYFCPDAGKIDLIVVAEQSAANHLENPSHYWDGISDYEPGDVGASGEGTEDSDGDGIDDGCQPPETCPCWDEVELLNVTADNQLDGGSCSASSVYPLYAAIQNETNEPGIEGGFLAVNNDAGTVCATRDQPLDNLEISAEQAATCISQIAQRCADIGDPITNGN